MKLRYLALAALSAACLASCDDDTPNTSVISSYFTISGDMSTGYTLYADGGGIVYPSKESITQMCGAEGFGKFTRGAFYISYTQENIKPMSDGTIAIEGGKLSGGQYIPVTQLMSLQEAESRNLTSSDSIFEIKSFDSMWAYRGYLNAVITTSVSVLNNKAIEPTFNLVFNQDSIRVSENELKLTLFCNRHSAKSGVSTLTGQYIESFSLFDMASMIPGNDSVTVKIEAQGSKTQNIKIAREDLRRGNYKGYKN